MNLKIGEYYLWGAFWLLLPEPYRLLGAIKRQYNILIFRYLDK